MSYSRPPSRSPSTSIFRRIVNATQVQAILEENDKLRTANAWCKSETEQAHRALWEATAHNSRLQLERDKLEMNVEDITSAWRRTRQSVLTGLEKEKQLQRSIKLRDEQARAYQQELEESQYSKDDLKKQKETVGADCFGSIRS
jgi:predicted nuclease with TOPRIM domain